jgi:hypothetical protein
VQRRVEELEREQLVHHAVAGGEHDAHAALAEVAGDLVLVPPA